jgi:hypothetical protein
MKAAVVHAFHVPPRYTSFAEPVATEGDVLVNVSAAGLHRVVKSLADGTHYASSEMLPLIPGVDGVGRLEDGTRVYFGMSFPIAPCRDGENIRPLLLRTQAAPAALSSYALALASGRLNRGAVAAPVCRLR